MVIMWFPILLIFLIGVGLYFLNDAPLGAPAKKVLNIIGWIVIIILAIRVILALCGIPFPGVHGTTTVG